MRSEVVKVKRDNTCGVFMGDEEEGSVYELLSDLLPEIPVGETKSVRISAEIVDEKGEEKVGSKVVLCKDVNGGAKLYSTDPDNFIRGLLKPVVADWEVGETRVVKSINFDTPSGVPEVEFEETPRERLKRAVDEIGHGLSWQDEHEKLRAVVQDYLAATEGEGK